MYILVENEKIYLGVGLNKTLLYLISKYICIFQSIPHPDLSGGLLLNFLNIIQLPYNQESHFIEN